MNNAFLKLLDYLSSIDNTYIFAFSIVPYTIFLFYLFKINNITKYIKLGFFLTVIFVGITIILSIYSEVKFNKSLVEVDILHGLAESFLTISDFIIFFGFFKLLKNLEVKNS